jgi:NAD(P)-dependent dehydrogenase (short-subunit alcohol dehydrogenase family)
VPSDPYADHCNVHRPHQVLEQNPHAGRAHPPAEVASMRAYGQSKLAQVAFGFRLAQQLDPAEVTVTSLHPSSGMPTKIVYTTGRPLVDSLERGVAATTRLAVDPELEGVTGVYTTVRTRLRRTLGLRTPRSKSDCGSSANS